MEIADLKTLKEIIFDHPDQYGTDIKAELREQAIKWIEALKIRPPLTDPTTTPQNDKTLSEMRMYLIEWIGHFFNIDVSEIHENPLYQEKPKAVDNVLHEGSA